MKILQHCFRRHVERENLDAAIALYEELEGIACERRVDIPETGTVAAKVGRFLILAGDAEHIARLRCIDAIFYVDDLDAFAAWARSRKVEILHEPTDITSGRNFTARHPDGLVVEYFEARS